MKFLRVLFLSILLFASACGSTARSENLFPNVPEKEMNQKPQFAQLPCNEGFLFGYAFSVDLNDQQSFWILSAHMEIATARKVDLTNKVYIIILQSPLKARILTADFKSNEVEIRDEKNSNKKFVTRTWKGDPSAIIDYLAAGAVGKPEVRKGNAANEVFPHATGRTCPPKQQGV